MTLASPAANLVANPGFGGEAAPGKPPAPWYTTGDGAVLSLEGEGTRTLRLERKAGTQFGGTAQTLDATPLRGKVVRAAVTLRGQDIGSGASGLYVRFDGEARKVLGFHSTYHAPVRGPEPERRTLRLLVPEEARWIQLGVMIASDGVMRADGFSLETLAAESLPPIAGSASKYLAAAIAIVRTNALHRDRVDWPRVEREANLLAGGAANEAETYGAIGHVLAALRDGHSSFRAPSTMRAITTNARTDDFNLESTRVHGAGYLSIPGFSGGEASRNAAFAAELKARIATLRAQGVAGWVIDLRDNTGGNMWPMLEGLASLLGDGRIGAFVGNGPAVPWVVRGGIPSADPHAKDAPAGAGERVAVITGPRTTSSGEAVAVAFRGTAGTRAFGTGTGGLSTANRPFALADGATILLTVSRFADRSGTPYGEVVKPDEEVPPPQPGTAIEEDPAVIAAATWVTRPR